MSRRLRLVVGSVVLALLVVAPPAAAEECVEVGQFRHCID